MIRPSVQRAALVEPVMLVAALITVLSSNPGLPDIPITVEIPEHDELAMASHGRGFWSLDNIAPLRQLQAGTTDRDLVLFTPAPAYRSANGVVLSWWVGEGGGSGADARLEIMDADGDMVRTFEPAEEGEERDRWAGPALPVGSGLQRLRWDLRTDPAATFPGRILGEVNEAAEGVGAGGDLAGWGESECWGGNRRCLPT